MNESYKVLLKEHVIIALTNPEVGTLKQFTQQLIQQNFTAREEILEAYNHINKELVGILND